jgi:hypothetical protein
MATKKKSEMYIIARGSASGVHAGVLVERKGSEVTLRNARRIWYWAGAASLSQLATKGTSRPSDCKFPAPVPGLTIKTDVCEIIECTHEAHKSIEGVAPWLK